MERILNINITIYRSIKLKKESKLDKNIKIEQLERMGWLKSYKHSLLFLSDSRNYNNIYQDNEITNLIYEEYISNKLNNYETYINKIYKPYIPRMSSVFFNNRNSFGPLDYYKSNLNPVNTFTKISLDNLIKSEPDDNNDWFIYNEESFSFLMNYEQFEFLPDFNNIKIIGNKIFFQDKLPYIIFLNKDQKSILINIFVNEKVLFYFLFFVD